MQDEFPSEPDVIYQAEGIRCIWQCLYRLLMLCFVFRCNPSVDALWFQSQRAYFAHECTSERSA